jgi:hypothetical protein
MWDFLLQINFPATLALWHIVNGDQSLSARKIGNFKVDDVGTLEAMSKPPVRIVEDSVTALAMYAMTLVTAWMP